MVIVTESAFDILLFKNCSLKCQPKNYRIFLTLKKRRRTTERPPSNDVIDEYHIAFGKAELAEKKSEKNFRTFKGSVLKIYVHLPT